MADILIRMDIPRNCFECPLFTNCDACEGYECGCGLLGGIGYEEDISEDRRRDDCPLYELPEHGDLISADDVQHVLDNLLKRTDDDAAIAFLKWANDCVRVLPKIVPSNREDAK